MGSIRDARRAGTAAARIDTVSKRNVVQETVSGSAASRPYNVDPIKRTIKREIWSRIAALAQPVTVKAGGKVDIVLQDKTVDVARFAARAGMPLDGTAFSLP